MNKQETYDYLTAHGVEYEVTEHPAVFNMEEMNAIEMPHPEADAKNLFVRDDKHRFFYLITVKGDKRVNLKEFRRQNGTKALTFASDEELASILGVIPGSVTPLGLLNDEERKVIFYLDDYFTTQTNLVGIHPNENTATVWIKPADLIRLIQEHGNEVHVVTL
jgi:Ala-tRNA(Pro) deacylase